MKSVIFNWEFFDNGLFYHITPLIHINAQFVFYNVNKITIENIDTIDIIEDVLTNYSIELYAEAKKSKFIFLYPAEIKSKLTNLEDIDIVLKLLKLLSNSFISDILYLTIWNAILDDTEVFYLWENRLWREMMFANCQILCSQSDMKINHFSQGVRFTDCLFEN